MQRFFKKKTRMGKFTEYKLPLKSMPDGIQTFEYHPTKQFFVNMENQEVRDADILVKLTVDHRNGVYDMTFNISGELTVACDRCLDDLILPVETDYHIIVKYGPDYDDANDDFLQIPESDNYLNVAYIIHDTVTLSIPIKHVHPHGKCNRAMSALLKRHRTTSADPEEADLEDTLMDEFDEIDSSQDATDSRWDKLKDFNPEES